MEFSRRVNQIQGPRPAALTLNTIQSVKIEKPAPPQMEAAKPPSRCPFDPVIAYLRSPTIIHVKPTFQAIAFAPAPSGGSSAENSANNASSSSVSSFVNNKCCLNSAGLGLAMPSVLLSPDFDGYNGFCKLMLDDFDDLPSTKANISGDFGQAFEL